MPNNRRDLGYLDLATPRKKQPISNPKVQHAETVLRKMNFLMDKTHGLMSRVDRIYQNENLSDNDKLKNSSDVLHAVEKNIQEMKRAINDERRAIYEEFTRIRKLNPGVPLDQHPELKSLKAASEKLAAFAESIKSVNELANTPSAPTFDPTLASMPLIPATKPVMTREQADTLINTTINEGWHSGDNAMTKFAKDTKEKVTQVKEQVIDELFEKKYEQVFGENPRDMTKEVTPPEAYAKPKSIDPLEKKYEEIFGEKPTDKLIHPDQDEEAGDDNDDNVPPPTMHR